MPHRIINSADDLASFTRFLGNLKLPVTVEWVQGRDRTRDQNALQWLWASQVASQTYTDAADVQAEWKLRYGVPILRQSSAEFRELYDTTLEPLPYEMKVRAMRDLGIAVTSQFKVRQMVQFLDTVQRETLQAGLELTDPDPELATYHARYRMKASA